MYLLPTEDLSRKTTRNKHIYEWMKDEYVWNSQLLGRKCIAYVMMLFFVARNTKSMVHS